MPLHPHDSIPTRRSLLERLKNSEDQQSWLEFFNTYWKLIYNVARQMGLSDAEAQDVVQETLIAVAKKMGQFKTDPARGSFKSWLLLIARRRINDQFRRRSPRANLAHTGSDATPRTAMLARVPDPARPPLEAIWQEEWEQNLVEVALQKVKELVSSKEFLLFYQQTFKEWPAAKVAKQYAVSLAQVYVAKYRVSRVLKRELKKLEQQII